MKAFRGVVAYPGFALGPAFVVSTWNDLVAISMVPMPVIVVAPYLEERMLDVIERARVYGFAVDHGSVIDPLFEQLAAVPKPSVIGCRGIYGAVEGGVLVAIDGDEGAAVVAPEGELLEHYRRRKGDRGRREPPEVMKVVGRLAEGIRTARLIRGYRAPLDLPEERGRLFEIARKVARGEAPTPEDDEYVRRLMEAPY